MKILCSIAIAVLASTSVFAQKFEIGINGGVSTTSRPNESLYQGKKGLWTYNADVNFHYNLSERWQAGLQVGLTNWERKEDFRLSGPNNQDLGNREVSYLLAKNAVSFAFQFNHVIPFYQRYEDYVKSQVYFGISAGAVVTGNDGKIVYSRVNPNTPTEYTYASEYHFNGGYGFLLGAQLGYTYFFNEHLGVNIDCSPRIAWMSTTTDARYGHANDRFNIIYFPTTIGIHYRFGYSL